MKRCFLLVVVFILLVHYQAARPEHLLAEAPHIIKFATLAPRGSLWLNNINNIADALDAKSDGRLRLKIYPAGVYGDEIDFLRKMRLGLLHSAGFTGFGLGTILKEVRILNLPLISTSYEEIDFVRGRLHERFSNAFMEQGYVLLGWADIGFVYFFSKKKINSLGSLRSTKMWVWEDDPMAKSFADALNVTTVPRSLNDVIISLQTGLVDSFYVSPLGAVALQWFSRIRYMLDVPIVNAAGAILITKKAYDELDADLQSILKKTFATHMKDLTAAVRAANRSAIDEIKKSGVELVTLSGKETKELRKIAKEMRSVAAGKLFPAESLNEVDAMINEYRNR